MSFIRFFVFMCLLFLPFPSFTFSGKALLGLHIAGKSENKQTGSLICCSGVGLLFLIWGEGGGQFRGQAGGVTP